MTKKTVKKLGEELVKKNAPEFVEMVQRAISNKNLIVALHPDKFQTPELLYAAVYYAVDQDVMITFYDHQGLHPRDRSYAPKGEDDD